jgi:hypothetical protein
MPKSIRIRTQPGIDKNINVKIDQDFEFLEILSLKLRQEDLYTRFCADYGVVVGRVIANGGYGVPNAHVSVFVPVDNIDENDPIISTLYPYKFPTSKNEDGFRYNLLPYRPEYKGHNPTGTFPSREDVLTRDEVLQVYEKYYKYTVRTNESGDFMIVGVPLGNQKIVLDLDLSNMGCFSLRPQDLIRMNLGVESQFNGSRFKSSTDIDSLPQIIHEIKDIDVASFWGQEDSCDVGITRVDFDLRELGIEFEPTATFMGSIFSSPDNQMMKKNCKPKTEQGDLCGLVTGPGEILALRQTINIDENDEPILEQYILPNGGKVIDDNGAFLTELPMNLDYIYTNEFGEEVISPDGSKGIPTKAKYRFKVKYQSEENGPEVVDGIFTKMEGEIMRANMVVPQIREYGWIGDTTDPGTDPSTRFSATTTSGITFNNSNLQVETITVQIPAGKSIEVISNSSVEKVEVFIGGQLRTEKWIDFESLGSIDIKVTKIQTALGTYPPVTININLYDYNYSKFIKSYAFSLNWDDYADKTSAIKCEDSFYEMTYNKVYTTAQLIEEYRRGSGRARFIGIKEIIDRGCENDTVRFPVNDGVRNFDFLFFIFNILITFLSIVLLPLTVIGHVICFLWPILRWIINIIVTVLLTFIIILCYAVKTISFGLIKRPCPEFQFIDIGSTCPLSAIPLPNLSYPDCQACECESRRAGQNEDVPEVISNTSVLANVTDYFFYDKLNAIERDGNQFITNDDWNSKFRYGFQIAMAGNDTSSNSISDKTPFLKGSDNPFTNKETFSADLPLAERLNLFNVKANYHIPYTPNLLPNNIIRVRVNKDIPANSNINKQHFDNVVVLLLDQGMENAFAPGQMLTFQNPNNSLDPNISGGTTGSTIFTTDINGQIEEKIISVNYMNPLTLDNSTTTYVITADTLNTEYNFPTDIEYYQVITGQTLGDFVNTNLFGDGLDPYPTTNIVPFGDLTLYTIFGWNKVKKDGGSAPDVYPDGGGDDRFEINVPTVKLNSDWENLVVVFLVRGVDPHTPRQDVEYDLSRLYGFSYNTVKVRGQYRLNIPIQKYNTTSDWRIPRHSDINTNGGTSMGQYIYYPSYTFNPGTGYTSYNSQALLDYSAYDETNRNRFGVGTNTSQYRCDKLRNQALAIDNNNPWGELAKSHTNNFHGENYFFGYRFNVVVEGGSAMFSKNKTNYSFFSPVYYEIDSTHSITMSDSSRIIMRTDRLPTSDVHDGRFMLHQNRKFAYYSVSDEGDVVGISIGSDTFFDNQDDFAEDSSFATEVLETFSCDKMVPLECYSGDGYSIGVYPTDNECYYVDKKKEVEKMTKGCYYLITKNFAIIEDFKTIAEWKSRFRIMFALCRNVVSLTFVNNWVNGSLYMYSLQKENQYDSNLNSTTYNTLPTYNYCKDTIVFQENNNSFFYRTSPFNKTTDEFTGKKPPQKRNSIDEYTATNLLLLGSPTTIMDMGPRDQFIQELCFNPEYAGYVIDRVASTSYKDTSDILQLFVISRLISSNFWGQITGLGDASIQKLFSRKNSRLDGDVVQMLSINSEFGVIPFLGDNYNEAVDVKFLKKGDDPMIGLFFSANTVNRDLITPGRVTFADTNTTSLTNYYGFKDQRVPFHPWKIKDNFDNTGKIIFGTQLNDWEYKITKPTNIKTINYQTIDRLVKDPTFKSDGNAPTTRIPGYIYNTEIITGNTIPITTNIVPKIYTSDQGFNSGSFKLLVGAPYHFYFGLKVGKTAMNKFITKYIPTIEL